jgi:hypothetical protein
MYVLRRILNPMGIGRDCIVCSRDVSFFRGRTLKPSQMSFLGFKVHAPLAVLAIVVYFLGAATGNSLLALLRRSYEGSKRWNVGLP